MTEFILNVDRLPDYLLVSRLPCSLLISSRWFYSVRFDHVLILFLLREPCDAMANIFFGVLNYCKNIHLNYKRSKKNIFFFKLLIFSFFFI